MGKLIRLEDAYICCRGTSQQIVKDTATNFAAIAGEFLAEHGRVREAGGNPALGVTIALAKVIKSVIDSQARNEMINSMILGVGATTALTQQFEWQARDVEVQGVEINAEGGLTIGQAITFMNVAAEEAQARARQRQRNCFFERALTQDNPAKTVYGAHRSRRARPGFTKGLIRKVLGFVTGKKKP